MALLFLDGLDKHLLQAGGFELLELGGNKQLETAEVCNRFFVRRDCKREGEEHQKRRSNLNEVFLPPHFCEKFCRSEAGHG